MKTKMTAMFMVLIIGLAAMGASYALWSETLTVSGTVATGNVDVKFDNVDCAEGPTEDTDLSDGKDVGSCVASASVDGNTLTVDMDNTYPCYWCNVTYNVTNNGSIPVKVQSIKLVKVSNSTGTYTLPTPVELATITRYYVDVDTLTVDQSLNEDVDDFSIHVTDIAVGQQIDGADDQGGLINSRKGDLHIHVEQGADEIENYDFTIEILAVQWNEYTE